MPLVNFMTMPSCVSNMYTSYVQNPTDDTPLVLDLLSGGGYGHIGGSVSLIDTYRRYCTVGEGEGNHSLEFVLTTCIYINDSFERLWPKYISTKKVF